MTSYFDVLSWTRARKNREELEKTNPQNPVLNQEDENFLQRITSEEAAAPPLPVIAPVVVDEDEGREVQKVAGEVELPVSPPPVEQEGEGKGMKRSWVSYIPAVGLPSLPGLKGKRVEKGEAKAGEKAEAGGDASALEGETQETQDDVSDGKIKETTGAEQGSTEKPGHEQTGVESDKSEPGVKADTENVQEAGVESKDVKEDTTEGKDQLPTSPDVSKAEPEPSTGEQETKDEAQSATDLEKDDTESTSQAQDNTNTKTETNPQEESKTESTEQQETEKPEEPAQRTWASYIPSIPSLTKNKTTTTEAPPTSTPEQDEREVTVLLDRLNLSAINNRVFSFSSQSEALYNQFTLILKDMVSGAPTAYEDLEKLIKENEKQLDQMFKNMPPFVKTLVTSLPARFASSLGPEVLAKASGSAGGADEELRRKMQAASSAPAAGSVQGLDFDAKRKQKKKRNIPGVKALASEKGAVTSMLTNIVNFLKVRFPAFVTGTNVVMSLAVFILLFVFWYCHKRGKETRLLRETESTKGSTSVSEVEDSDSEDQDSENEDSENEASSSAPKSEVEVDVDEKAVSDASPSGSATPASGQKVNVGGPDNASAARAKKILEQSTSSSGEKAGKDDGFREKREV